MTNPSEPTVQELMDAYVADQARQARKIARAEIPPWPEGVPVGDGEPDA